MSHFRSIKIKGQLGILVLLSLTLFTAFCKKKEDVQPQLNISLSEVAFQPDGGISNITVTSNGKWNTKNPADLWLQISQTAGSEGNTELKLTAMPNLTGASRSAVMVVNSDNGQARRVTISQTSTLFPSYNTSPKAPDQTGMNSAAVQLAAKMKLGGTLEIQWNRQVVKVDGVIRRLPNHM